MKNKIRYFTIALILGSLLFSPCGFAAVSLKDIETAIIKRDYTQAQKLAGAFMDQGPAGDQLLEARYYFGLSGLYLKMYSQAREHFQEILRGQPGEGLADRARVGLIDSYYMAGEYEDALAEIQGFLKQRPGSDFMSLIYLKLARTNLKLAQWSEARRYLRRIIREFPDSPECHVAKQLLEEKQYFAVQVGSFIDRQHALNLVDELKKKGEYAYIVETIDKTGTRFSRVRVGRFSLLDQAESLRQKLSSLGYPTRIYP